MPSKKPFSRAVKKEIRYQKKMEMEEQRLQLMEQDKQKEKAWFTVWAMGFSGRKIYKNYTVFINLEFGMDAKEIMDRLEKGFGDLDYVRKI